MLIGAVGAILALVIFVTVHELGHFLAAKAVGIKATEFFFGFGPRIFSFRRGETEYGMKAIPLGGYVRILGMNPMEEVAPEEEQRSYRSKSFWRKSVVVLAGVGVNFFLGYLLFFGLVMTQGVTEPTTEIASVNPSGEPTPAAAAGLRSGDVIVKVAGTETETWGEVGAVLAAHPGERVPIVVLRDGDEIQLTAALAAENPVSGEKVGYLGVAPVISTREVGLAQGMVLGGELFAEAVRDTFTVLGNLVRPETLGRLAGVFFGSTDVPLDQRPVSPIGIGQIGAQVDRIGLPSFLFFLAAINVTLACFNLLPLLPLDGGHFAVALFEKLTGRRVDMRYLAPVAAAVVSLVIFLGLVAIVLDIVNPIRF